MKRPRWTLRAGLLGNGIVRVIGKGFCGGAISNVVVYMEGCPGS